MSLETYCLREFDAVARARGEDEFQSRLVQLELIAASAAKFRILAKSQDQDPIAVYMDWSETDQRGVLRSNCSCPAFHRHGEFCHHVWAALLAMDSSEQSELIAAREMAAQAAGKSARLTLQPLKPETGLELLKGAIDVEASQAWPLEKIRPTAVAKLQREDGSPDGWRLEPVLVYGDLQVDPRSAEKCLLDPERSVRLKRNLTAEKAYLKCLQGPFALKKLGSRPLKWAEAQELVSTLLENAWRVEIESKPVVTLSGVQCVLAEFRGEFAFNAAFEFSGPRVGLKSVIEYSAAGERFLPLGDGRIALLPEDWIRRIELLRRSTRLTKEGYLSLSRASLPLFKPVFDDMPGLKMDTASQKAFASMTGLSRTGHAETPQQLRAQLRSYQSEGLFWLKNIAACGFGGILADDMGLGKTIQIISYLLHRTQLQKSGSVTRLPSLVVLPKSLVANWLGEIEKFGPSLKVLDFAGANRGMLKAQDYNVVVTTYHVLKNELDRLEKIEFDTIILDEAQAIKNPSSQIAQAAFALNGRHRFALSGTPIENSLGDLFSLMRFANPGLIPPTLENSVGDGRGPDLSKEALERLALAVRPFVLRRTKKQVLTELPDKCEQTLYCEMEGSQKKLYEQLRRHYKASLKKEVSEKGLGKAKIQVFEALLRLRQTACHPGLVDKEVASGSSAKVEALLEHLDEIRKAGHKALVFSQFTSFLKLLKPHLKKAGIRFEYLDGQTNNRGAVVDRFNSDKKTTVFLISLKAGGTGLNLTTASYVFLMDPWWNPAIEAQAIDRAYRMGQKQKVMAYRLIAKGTIEEKITQMQAHKRSLAQAVISDEPSFLRSLSLEDLAVLLD